VSGVKGLEDRDVADCEAMLNEAAASDELAGTSMVSVQTTSTRI